MVIKSESNLSRAEQGVDVTVTAFEVKASCSSSRRVNGAVFWALTIVLAAVSAFSAWWGAWLVLPFAGMELLILGAGLAYSQHRLERVEHIKIDGQEVSVKNKSGICVFKRAWLQLELRPSALRNHPTRLFLGSHGRRVEVGDFLCEDEKRVLANCLSTELRRGMRNPANWFLPQGVYV